VDHLLGGGVAVGGVALMLFSALALAATVFWRWMLVDALTNEPDTNRTILWFLVSPLSP